MQYQYETKEKFRFYHDSKYRGELIMPEIPEEDRAVFARFIVLLYNALAKKPPPACAGRKERL